MTSAPRPKKLLIRDFVPPDGHYHVARHVRGAGHVSNEHTHDFPEVFWVEEGRAMHCINGLEKSVRAGDLVLIRPPDCHGFYAPRSEGNKPVFGMVNVAFRAGTLAYLRKRYFASGRAVFPWKGAALPSRYHVGAGELRRLAELADGLARGPQSLLRLEGFLLAVLELIEHTAPVPMETSAAVPDWLRGALPVFAQPAHLAGGVRELSRLAGRGPEHLNRVVRRCLGETTTDLVNRLRLDYAARELTMSGRSILDISLEAGFENLSYFYRVFRKRFGETPRRFRARAQMLVR
ncbi:MAG: helix-turn-helix domain-containing protein [Planctomycetota bacterium]|nr:helix-turn-helix domain-containing protein [Planctomycetota bacterium]